MTTTAQILARQRTTLAPVFLEPAARPASIAAGYQLQGQANAMLAASGLGPPAGHKIGCTTPVMQNFLGISTPCAGEVFSSTVLHEKGVVSGEGYRKLGVECEIVAIMGSDIDHSMGPFTRDTVTEHVQAIAAGIEIVDDRYLDYRTLGVETLIADNFFNAGCVLGNPVVGWRNLPLEQTGGHMMINGSTVGQGLGSMVLGHPLEALAWLANLRISQGLGLRRGAFVFLGSLVETKWLQPGDEVLIEIERLGSVRLSVY